MLLPDTLVLSVRNKQNGLLLSGIMAGSKQDDEIWNSVSKTAKIDNVTLKFKRFTDYNQPNKALENGDVDLNAFQHKLFLQTWNKAHKVILFL